MSKKYILFFLIGFLPCVLLAQELTSESPKQADPLVGNWKIDLRPTPDSEAYFQSFVVENIEGNTFKGTFYGSQVQNALINRNWDRVYFAFSTSDSTHDYYHSGYLENGKLYGISYCPTREFTAPWTGVVE